MEKVQKEAENRQLADESKGLTDTESKDNIKDKIKEKSTADSLKALLGADDSKNFVTIALPADVIFESGTANLSQKSAHNISEIADLLRNYTDIEEIEITGHTDSQTPRTKSEFNNWTLSVQRAAAVADTFVASGLPKSILRISGRGDSSPILPEKTTSGQWIQENMRRNRRIEILIRREKTSVTLNKK
jgi:flagellar motor protein MotB